MSDYHFISLYFVVFAILFEMQMEADVFIYEFEV